MPQFKYQMLLASRYCLLLNILRVRVCSGKYNEKVNEKI